MFQCHELQLLLSALAGQGLRASAGGLWETNSPHKEPIPKNGCAPPPQFLLTSLVAAWHQGLSVPLGQAELDPKPVSAEPRECVGWKGCYHAHQKRAGEWTPELDEFGSGVRSLVGHSP